MITITLIIFCIILFTLLILNNKKVDKLMLWQFVNDKEEQKYRKQILKELELIKINTYNTCKNTKK